MPRKRKLYISPRDLEDALLDSQARGEPTVALCRLFRLLISHYLLSPRYFCYSAVDKEDMGSQAFVKCLKNVKNFRSGRGNPVSYFLGAIQCACLDWLSKHYRQTNLKRELAELPRGEWRGAMPIAEPRPVKTPPLSGAKSRGAKTHGGRNAAQGEGNECLRG